MFYKLQMDNLGSINAKNNDNSKAKRKLKNVDRKSARWNDELKKIFADLAIMEIEKGNRPSQTFSSDCIGAFDGTHVAARLPRGQEIAYFGRKGYATQNILAVVDFNMCFTFAWAGWEGSAHDARIFGEALRRRDLNFPKPTGDKYYLVDGGYSHTKGYMGPYKGSDIRYHLAEFRRARTRQQRQPRNLKEKFNFLHSSCRNIVERTFGVWKARFLILKNMPNYGIQGRNQDHIEGGRNLKNC